MLMPSQKVLICGVRIIERKEKSTLYLLDFYIPGEGAKTSFINVEDVPFYKNLIGKFVTCDLDVGEYKGNLSFRVLKVS
ncbi:hypothetical protein ERICII_04142 (plasmid) [Paenibacillus larvae subsp. larvae DSM 25430]|nr:hypothetical protein ERICII_04142 [Paenibacillus larvae subsp. larvae DSM 25430]